MIPAQVVVTPLFTTNSELGLLVRYTDAGNYWYLTAENAGLVLYQFTAGGVTSRLSAASQFSANTPATIKATCYGSTITVYVDGVVIGSYASATQGEMSTLVGMAGYDGGVFNVGTLDNFQVTS